MGLSQTLHEQLGERYSAKDVAKAFTKPLNWVYKNANALGGVKLGREWLFFEKNIVSAVRPTNKEGRNADFTHESERPEGMVRPCDAAKRQAQGEETPNEAESFGMGSFDEAEIEGILLDEDPCNLLAHPHDKASARPQGKRRRARNV